MQGNNKYPKKRNIKLLYKCTKYTSTSNNNVINGVNVFISEELKGSLEWYFKSDTAGCEFGYSNKIKLKTLIDKISNLTKFSIFFSPLFKPLMT